jgi:DNA-binding NtrC family response regulator
VLRMDARIIALTNADLNKAVAASRFREDLFFRLNVLSIQILPLRQRPADIAPLSLHFLERLGPVHTRADASLDPSTVKLLEAYNWPGNVRELKNAIEHALLFATDPLLLPKNFPQIIQAKEYAGGVKSLEDLEREAIKTTLDQTHYKIGRAAELLGISRKTLLEKRKRYGLI